MGRTLSEDAAYARELGVSKHVVRGHGGATRLRALDPDTRNLLLKPAKTGLNSELHKGGLAARGMGQRARKRI